MRKPFEKVMLSREMRRAKPKDFINYLFKDVLYMKGDRLFGEDGSILGGIGSFEGRPITFISNHKGHDLKENIEANFGMSNPEGYRKAQRMMLQAEKFGRPVITFVDTPGAYPGLGAEERGQGEAIARAIMTMEKIQVPTITFVTGEGGSGGALALSMGNKIYMLENAVYSILSPEGFSSILWKDKSQAERASEVMKLTAEDLRDFGIVDEIIPEDEAFIEGSFNGVFELVKAKLREALTELDSLDKQTIVERRRERFRNIGRRY